MIKPGTFDQYLPELTALAEATLLEAWALLGEFHPYLVLVGGLAPRFMNLRRGADGQEEHCGTMDVDFGVSLAIEDARAYSRIQDCLLGAGFRRGRNPDGNTRLHSFEKDAGDGRVIPLDFLTTHYEGPKERIRQIQGSLSAIQVEGMGLALKDPLNVPVRGVRLEGGIVETTLRVCRPVPFVVLKSLAFENRHERKDAYDLVHVLKFWSGGPASVASLANDEERQSPSFQHAMDVLTKNFKTPDMDGPVSYARLLKEPSRNADAFAAVEEFLKALASHT